MAEEKKKDRNTAAVEKYLHQRAASDPVLAEKLKDPSKSIDKCMEFIKNKARQQAIHGCAMIEDQVVYGWAVHYYDEVSTETKATAATTIQTETKQPEPQEKKKEFVQLSLFD